VKKLPLDPVDPVTRYATEVVALRIVACRLVRLTCQRHLTDLKQQKAKGLLWKPAAAQEAIDFFPEVLCLPEETDVDEDVEALEDISPEGGTPFVLSPFQQFIVGSLFGWFQVRVSAKTGARRESLRFSVAFFQGGKGCGKTPLGAGILIFMLVRRGVRGAQLFCAGAMKEQALIPFADCVKMREASPALKELITLTGNNLAVKATGSFIRPISSDSRSQSGKRVQGAVIEELHEHANAGLVLKMRAGIKGRPNALLFMPTNTGFDLESVCYEYYDYSRQILEGTVVNESWFAFVCQLDACDRCHAAGKLQPSDDCPNCDDWKTEGPHWLKANPNLGVSIPWEYLRSEVRVGVAIPSQRNMVRRLNFCQWTQQRDVWLTAEQWAACAGLISRAGLVGRECFVGIDLSDTIDLSSVVCIFPRALDREPGASDQATDARAPEDPARPAIDRAIDVLSFFWMPDKTLYRRAHEDKISYPDWKQGGFIFTTPGSIIDHDAIVEFLIGTLAVQFTILGVGIDDAGASAVVTRLQRHFGHDESKPPEQRFVWAVPQGFRRLSAPSKWLEALVVSLNLAHDGNPCMAWCITNMGKEENAWREIRPVKITQRKRIDGGVALIDAIAKMTATPAAPRSVYETRGLVTTR
jgi:phage terminase large subunit-like protein